MCGCGTIDKNNNNNNNNIDDIDNIDNIDINDDDDRSVARGDKPRTAAVRLQRTKYRAVDGRSSNNNNRRR